MKKKLLPFVALSIILTSCSRDNDDVINNPITNPVAQTPLLPLEIGNGKHYSLKYTYDNNHKLISAERISNSSGNIRLYDVTYDGDLIKSIKDAEFVYDNQQRLVKVLNKTTKETLFTFTYSGNKIKYFSNVSQFLMAEEVDFTVENGVIIKGEGIAYERYVDPDTPRDINHPTKITVIINYDNKKNIFGNIKGLDKLHPYLVTNPYTNGIDTFGLGSKNNVTKYIWHYKDPYGFEKEKGSSEFIYSYGDNNLPTEYNLTYKGIIFPNGLPTLGKFNIKYNR